MTATMAVETEDKGRGEIIAWVMKPFILYNFVPDVI